MIFLAGQMLGQILVTKQTGPQGKIVSKVWLTNLLNFLKISGYWTCNSLSECLTSIWEHGKEIAINTFADVQLLNFSWALCLIISLMLV